MTEAGRDAIFISHANPEDNAFTVWLGVRLTAAGYQVRADVLRLRGGQDWQRRLEGRLRNKAFKVLLVGTAEGIKKQGVRNEIQIAHSVGRRIGDPDFVIPLRLTDFDAPFLIAHAQYIDFKRSWADGLAELLETLEHSYGVPRRRDCASETMDNWKQVHTRHGQSLRAKSESLVSNWLRIEELPEAVSLYDFRGPVSIEDAVRQKSSAKWPVAPFRRGFLAFCQAQDLQDHFGPSLPLKVVDEIGSWEFLDDGWPDQNIEKWDAHNQFGNLVRQALELMLRGKLLRSYELVNNQLAKAVFDVPTTRALVERLGHDSQLRRLCGWERAGGLPSEAT
ncbi:MAG: toll/interleukin-1 receptor domain-containing protein, partial [Bryobacterales bacterium]|nr:toll/interleukin-1 receptor domain-containing protein [Bryobacterales bacterium]